MKRSAIYAAIDDERVRQDAKFGGSESPTSILPGKNAHAKVSVLTEEVGEVARAVLERDDAGLEAELVQVAAVCVAWLEATATREQTIGERYGCEHNPCAFHGDTTRKVTVL